MFTHGARRPRGTGRAAVVAALLTLGTLIPSGGTDGVALAKDEVTPLGRHLESLHVGPGAEHRLVVVHPLYAPRETALAAGLDLASAAPRDAVGVARVSEIDRRHLKLDVLGDGDLLALPGDLVRVQQADYAVREHAVAPAGGTAILTVDQVTKDVAADAPPVEPAVLGPLLGPGFTYLLLDDPKSGDLIQVTRALGQACGCPPDSPRRSPADFGAAERIRDRVADYRARLANLPRPTAVVGRELVGYAVLIDGAPAALVSFGRSDLFTSAWPRLLEGIAVEAALTESDLDLLEAEMSPPSDPDRFLSAVKTWILKLYGVSPDARTLRGVGQELDLERRHTLGRALVTREDQVAHLLVVVDPANRHDTGEEGFDPGPISRRSRPTQAEQRWLDRRQGRAPAPNPVEPPK